LQLNAPCWNTFQPITIPIGDECFGRIMDAVGNPIDQKGPINAPIRKPIRILQQTLSYDLKQKKAAKLEVLETGLKYFDLYPLVKADYRRGRLEDRRYSELVTSSKAACVLGRLVRE
jgi:F0F1-type ATP synthase beta subunit